MNQQEKEQHIRQALLNKTLKAAHYYLINRPGYFYPNQPEQLVDAAVELQFGDESFFSMGMHFQYVAIDAFNEEFGPRIKNFNASIPYVKLNLYEDRQWAALMGKKITEVHVTWNWFEDLDEERHYIPQDIEMILEGGHYLAFCTTAYTLDEDGISILGPDSEGEILVLFSEEDVKHFKRGRYYDPAAFEHLNPKVEEPDFDSDDE